LGVDAMKLRATNDLIGSATRSFWFFHEGALYALRNPKCFPNTYEDTGDVTDADYAAYICGALWIKIRRGEHRPARHGDDAKLVIRAHEGQPQSLQQWMARGGRGFSNWAWLNVWNDN